MAPNHYDPNWQPPYPGPPQCSHDGRGPYYPPAHPPASSSRPRPPSNAGVPANPQPPPMPIFPPSAGGSFRLPQASTRNLPITNYKMEQKVSARITTDAWVMGFIVGVVHFCTKITGGTYTVEFVAVDGSGRHVQRDFTNEDLLPYWPTPTG